MTLARGTDRIESARLVLRRISADDLDFITRIHADPDVARYLAHGRPRSSEESLAWLQRTLTDYENFGLGQLAVLRKTDGMLIGRCGLSDLVVEVRTTADVSPRAWYGRAQAPPNTEVVFEPELGYTFDRSSWGQGYATEAACCVFECARDVLRLPRVISVIHPDNVRSLRVAQRCGLQREDGVEMHARPYGRYVWPLTHGREDS